MRPVALGAALLTVTSSLLLALAPARGEEGKADELKALRERIDRIESDRKHTEEEIGAASAALREQDLAIAAAGGRLREIEQGIAARTASLRDLAARHDATRAHLAGHRQDLARGLRAAYLSGRRDTLKLLLNQEDPQRLGRILAYHSYVNRARVAQIDAIKADLAEIDGLTQAIKLETDKLRELHAEQEQGLRTFEGLRSARSQVVQRLKARAGSQQQELLALRADETGLQKLIESLREKRQREAAEDGASPSLDKLDTGPSRRLRTGFARLKGKLKWPLRGRIGRKFGQSNGDAELTSRGVFIEAGAGTEVHAVSGGRVVFADWLQSLGLLIIVDHDDGYMSLYGHNQSLGKGTGEAVKAGEVVAVSGDSGGIESPGLYFEIRHNGAPMNPAQWCR